MQWTEKRFFAFGKSVRVPRDLTIVEQPEGVVTLTMAPGIATVNLQRPAAAFETWALAVRVLGAQRVILRWEGAPERDAHFGRLCYRVTRFRELFSAWFEAASPYKTEIPSEPSSGPPRFLLNKESKKREPVKEQVGALDFSATEHDLELALSGDHNAANLSLMRHFKLDIVDRQLPVGVYAGKVADPYVVCSGDKSAVDLWGITKSGKLVLFELKKRGNVCLGVSPAGSRGTSSTNFTGYQEPTR